MSAKYTPLPMSDPDATSVNFESIHLYKSVHDYPTNRIDTNYSSIFTYGGQVTISRATGTQDVTRTSLLSRYCEALVIFVAYLLFLLTLPLSGWFSIKTLQGHERLVVFRLGRLLPAKGPGMVLVLPLIDRATKVDLRTKAFSVPPQKVLTTDGAIIEVGADVYYNVQDAIMSVSNVQDLNHSTRIISQTLLQKQLGRYDLEDLDTKKVYICSLIQNDINQMSLTWGVKVERIELSAIKILQPPDPAFSQQGNPLQKISSILFPSGSKEMPIQTALQQMGQFLGAGDTKVSTGSVVSDGKSPQDLLDLIKPQLSESLVEEFNCVYCFNITGGPDTEEADVYFLDLKYGEGQVGRGSPPRGPPDVTLTMSVEDMGSMLQGDLSMFSAYMGGSLQVDGDLSAANKLGTLAETLRGRLQTA